jgi:tetratricopeptide (TPR) repeat protein
VGGKLREIGQALRVSHVLEGSVRRSGNHVVINVQLVDTRNDKQIWSERYERSLTDALSLQGEVAVQIARELQATLTPNEMSVVTTKPTENPEAYLLSLRAREMELRFLPSDADEEAATKFYQQAIDLDPTFALARARLSIWASNSFFSSLDKRPEGDPSLKAKALAEAEEALRLRPRLGEARLALGYYYLFVTADFDRALTELSQAEQLMPNSAEVWKTRGMIYKRQNKLRERIAALRRAEILDPRDTDSLVLLQMTLRAVRDWPEAIQTRHRIWALLPQVPRRGKFLDAFDEFRLTGKTDLLKQVTSQASTGREHDTQEDYLFYGFEVAMLERDFVTAERFLRELPAKAFDGELHPKAMEEALLAVARGGDHATVERTLIFARQEVEKLVAASPNNGEVYSNLGLIDAFLGRKDDAIREGRRALEMWLPDSLEKNNASAALALIYAWTGESDRAIELVEHLLTVPALMLPETIYNMTLAELKWRWEWDPLRNDPRFQKIIAGPEPKTVY